MVFLKIPGDGKQYCHGESTRLVIIWSKYLNKFGIPLEHEGKFIKFVFTRFDDPFFVSHETYDNPLLSYKVKLIFIRNIQIFQKKKGLIC